MTIGVPAQADASPPATSSPATGLNRSAMTKTARHRTIVELLQRHPVRSQVELAELLAAHAVVVTQATLSRDLVELGAVKVRLGSAGLVYAIPGEGGDRTPLAGVGQEVLDARLARLCEELLVSAEASARRTSWPRRSTAPSCRWCWAPSPGMTPS
jgi:transcriptional regulator of arginine metabolism